MYLQPDFASGSSNFTTELNASCSTGLTTFRGFVLAAIIPLMFGIRCSAIPLAALSAKGVLTSITSTPPLTSLSNVAVFPLTSSLVANETKGISSISAIIPPI